MLGWKRVAIICVSNSPGAVMDEEGRCEAHRTSCLLLLKKTDWIHEVNHMYGHEDSNELIARYRKWRRICGDCGDEDGDKDPGLPSKEAPKEMNTVKNARLYAKEIPPGNIFNIIRK